MSLLKVNEVQNYNGSSLTLTASTVSTSAQLNTGGNISVTGSINVSDDSTTRSNLGLGTMATQASDSIDINGGTIDGTTIGGTSAAAGTFTTFTSTGIDDNATSTALTIDSSGNLLVGTTSTGAASGGSGTSGININSSGAIEIARSANPVMFVNRTTSDGTVVDFRKDGSSVGHIGTLNGSLYIASPVSTDSGLRWSGSVIHPCDTSGAPRDNAIDLGYSAGRFDDIYATNGTIQTSDVTEKENITTSDLSLDFIRRLNPVSYRFIGKTRKHYGLIAQEIESLLSTIGIQSSDFAGFIKSPVTDEDGNETGKYKYGLRYGEFISPMIKAIQEQQALIESQQSQIDALTARIEALETA